MGSRTDMTATLSGSGTPRLQQNWDARAACNFIGGGSGTGLLLTAAVAFASGWNYFLAGALAIALIGFGLSMVWLEIGRPLRALNVFFHPQTSWMTREALLALPLLTLGAFAVLLDQPFVFLPFQAHMPVAVLAATAAILGLAFLYCQARILHASKGVPAWGEPALQPLIVITGVAEGLGLLLFLTALAAPPPVWAVPAAIIAVLARAGAWDYYRQRLKTRAPAPAVAALDRISVPVHLLGHALPAALLVCVLLFPSTHALAAVAGLALAAVGAWIKFAVVTRAAFTQGFSIPFAPIRGRSHNAAP
jgi:phenylacetyl-CoA:acceptor oxidoreductase 26-kDa subunit